MTASEAFWQFGLILITLGSTGVVLSVHYMGCYDGWRRSTENLAFFVMVFSFALQSFTLVAHVGAWVLLPMIAGVWIICHCMRKAHGY